MSYVTINLFSGGYTTQPYLVDVKTIFNASHLAYKIIYFLNLFRSSYSTNKNVAYRLGFFFFKLLILVFQKLIDIFLYYSKYTLC